MRKLITLGLALLSTTGCIIYTDDEPNRIDPTIDIYVNSQPFVLWGDAGCYYDRSFRDDIWYFEAEVDDFDGPLDVISVWADVYDEWDGSWVESFELFPTNDPYMWYSDWLGSSTFLDCYYNNYTVDIVAYDSFDEYDYTTVWARTY
jgi:hypothetical protein